MPLVYLAQCLCLAYLAIAGEVTTDSQTVDPRAEWTSDFDAADAEIRAAAAEFAAAFGRGDAASLAKHWTVDGDYVDQYGKRFTGRAAIQAEYERFFQRNTPTPMHIAVDSVRLIGPATAIEDGRVTLGTSHQDPCSPSRYTAVHVRQDGKWLMATVRDTRVTIASHFEQIADLEWLIGDWHAEHEDVQLAVSYRWIVDKRVLERTHHVKEQGQVTSTGIHIILWDSTSHCIKSWMFSSCGGYAVGEWSSNDRGWTVETTGVTSDGTPTSATNILSRVQDNTLSWKSTGRALRDVILPETDEVELVRE